MFSRSGHGDRCKRLPGCDYRGSAAYFITVVCDGRAALFGRWRRGQAELNSVGRLVGEYWKATPVHFPEVVLDAWVVMPNHFHGILVIPGKGSTDSGWGQGMPWPHPVFRAAPKRTQRGPASHSLGAIIGSFKSAVTRRVNQLKNTPGAQVWQSSFYDHLIRGPADLLRAREYIRQNPFGGSGVGSSLSLD
jgi:hypothetical protein